MMHGTINIKLCSTFPFPFRYGVANELLWSQLYCHSIA